MALRKCEECGKEISSDAKVCPQCGKPQPKLPSPWGCAIGSIVFIFLIIFIIAALLPNTPNTSPTDKDLFFKCLDTYPDDARICVSGELKRNSFDTVQGWLKQWVAAHPNTGKKRK